MSARSVQPHQIWMLDGREQDAWFALASEQDICIALKAQRNYLQSLMDEAALASEAYNRQIAEAQGIS